MIIAHTSTSISLSVIQRRLLNYQPKKYKRKQEKEEEDNIVAKGSLHTLLHSLDRTRPSVLIWAFLKGNSFKYVKYMALELK